MAKIKLRIDSLDSVEESLQSFYTEDSVNGGFTLQAEQDPSGLGIGPVSSLRGKLDEATRKEAKVKGMLITKEDDSLWTRDEIDSMSEELKSLKELNSQLTSKTSSSEETLREQVASAKGPLQKENADLKSSLDRYRQSLYSAEAERVVDRVVKIMKPSEEWDDLIRSDLTRHVKIEEVDGRMTSKFVDPETGATRFSSGSNNDGPMDYMEFASSPELLSKYARCLQGDGKQGAELNNQQKGRAPKSTSNTAGPRNVEITKTDARDFEKWI